MNWFSGGLCSRRVIVLSLPPSKHKGIEIGTGSQVGYAPAGSLFYRPISIPWCLLSGNDKTMTLRENNEPENQFLLLYPGVYSLVAIKQ
jgi:hypothetical protein